MTKIRVEVVLTDADVDIIEEMQASGMQRATFFKSAVRANMKRKEEERFDERVKRLLDDVLSNHTYSGTAMKEVKPKKTLGFGSKRVVAELDN